MIDLEPDKGVDGTLFLQLSWKDCYALRALLREHEDDPRIRAMGLAAHGLEADLVEGQQAVVDVLLAVLPSRKPSPESRPEAQLCLYSGVLFSIEFAVLALLGGAITVTAIFDLFHGPLLGPSDTAAIYPVMRPAL